MEGRTTEVNEEEDSKVNYTDVWKYHNGSHVQWLCTSNNFPKLCMATTILIFPWWLARVFIFYYTSYLFIFPGKSLLIFLSNFRKSLFGLLLRSISSLCILGIKPVLNIWLINIFFYFICCFLNYFFCCIEIFILDEINFPIFVPLFSFKNILPDKWHEGFASLFF